MKTKSVNRILTLLLMFRMSIGDPCFPIKQINILFLFDCIVYGVNFDDKVGEKHRNIFKT